MEASNSSDFSRFAHLAFCRGKDDDHRCIYMHIYAYIYALDIEHTFIVIFIHK